MRTLPVKRVFAGLCAGKGGDILPAMTWRLPDRRRGLRSWCLVVLGCCAVGGTPRAAERGALVQQAQAQWLRMTDFLDTVLPGTLGARNLALHFTPKFADVRDREFVRFPLELRYGVTERMDLSGGLTPFVPNPFNSGREHRWGPGEAKLGVRYDLGPAGRIFDDTTVGLETRVPLGHPPVQLNDHHAHVRPFLSASRELRAWRSTTLYANLAYDRSVTMRTRDQPPAWVLKRHVIEAVPGLLYKPGAVGGFVEYRLRAVQEPAARYRVHEGRVGAVWEVPPERSAKWRLPGRWQIEAAFRHEFTAERGSEPDSGFVTRVTWRTSLREVLASTTEWMGTATR